MKKRILIGIQVAAITLIVGGTTFALAPPKVDTTPSVQNSVPEVKPVEESPKEEPKIEAPAPLQEQPKVAVAPAPAPAPTQPEPVITPFTYGLPREWFRDAGVGDANYRAVDHILSKESSWCPYNWEGEVGACRNYHGAPTDPSIGYGLCQATPANKMASAGSDWATNPTTQMKWCDSYAKERYGGWGKAYQFWLANRWW